MTRISSVTTAPRPIRSSHRWETLALGDFAETQYGISVNTSASSSVPIIGMRNLQDGEVDVRNLDFAEVSQEELNRYLLKDKDLLFNRTNSKELVGKTSLFRLPDKRQFVFASYLVRISVDKSVMSPEFLCYYMQTSEAATLLRSIATPGVSQYNINPTSLAKKLLVPRPFLDEQKRITEVLGLWDGALALANQLLEKKKTLKSGLSDKLLTGNIRNPRFANSAWKRWRLGELFGERNEKGREDLPLLSITADRGVVSREEIDRKDSSSESKKAYKRIVPGDLGYNTMRMWQGVSGLSALEGIISPAYTVCVPGHNIDARYAAHLFKFPPVVHLFYRHSQGLVDDTLNLKFSNFARIAITIPSFEEQRWIASVLSAFDEDIVLQAKYRDALQEQRRALMENLLTGKIALEAGHNG